MAPIAAALRRELAPGEIFRVPEGESPPPGVSDSYIEASSAAAQSPGQHEGDDAKVDEHQDLGQQPVSYLTHLILCSNVLMPEGCELLMDAVASGRRLRVLDLSSNGIRDDGFEHVAAVLRRPDCPLTRVSLAHNSAAMRGLEAIADAMAHNSTVLELDVRGNDWGDAGAVVLAQKLRQGNNFDILKLVRCSSRRRVVVCGCATLLMRASVFAVGCRHLRRQCCLSRTSWGTPRYLTTGC